MSEAESNNAKENKEGNDYQKQHPDEIIETKCCKIQDEGATFSDGENSKTKDIVPDTTSEIVQALEQELSERKKQIVTSFQLQELNNTARSRRRSSVKSNIVIWSRAEEQYVDK